jgi:hypothetical protein
MGWFDFLFGPPDVATTWRERPGLELVLNLDRHTICELKLGDRADRISILGPPDNKKPTRADTYLYASKGIELCTGEDGIETITAIFEPTDHWVMHGFEKKAAAYGGKIIYGGKPVALSRDTSEGEFVGRFGQPYWRDEDEYETTLFYEFGPLEWQVEFETGGGLRGLVLESPPTMAQAEARAAYQVDKAWPPG